MENKLMKHFINLKFKDGAPVPKSDEAQRKYSIKIGLDLLTGTFPTMTIFTHPDSNYVHAGRVLDVHFDEYMVIVYTQNGRFEFGEENVMDFVTPNLTTTDPTLTELSRSFAELVGFSTL